MNEVATKSSGVMQLPPEVLSSLVLSGDVSKLDPKQKMQYYVNLCDRVGIDPATQPFKLLKLNGKEIFYADKGATQQLSQLHNISHEITKRERVEDVYVVTVRAKLADGRYTDEDGAVTIGGLTKDNLANALMKATTKAKRRAVLALLGLGMMDESEIETVPNAVPVEMPRVETPSVQDAVVVETKSDGKVFDAYKTEIENALNLNHLKEVWGAVIISHKNGELTDAELKKLTTLKNKAKEILK